MPLVETGPGLGMVGGDVERGIGDLAEVLDNLGVFRCQPDDLLATCPSGFRQPTPAALPSSLRRRRQPTDAGGAAPQRRPASP